jgi:hypothetical protein
MAISRSAYFKFKKEERPVIALLEKYFSKEELEEFLHNGKIERFEQFNNMNAQHVESFKSQLNVNTSIGLLADYAKYGLNNKINELFKIFGIPDFTMFLPKKLFIKILNDIKSENSLTHENGKAFLLQRLKGYETSITKLEHKNHPKILYDFVSNKLSKIEVYILIHNAEEYLS